MMCGGRQELRSLFGVFFSESLESRIALVGMPSKTSGHDTNGLTVMFTRSLGGA